MARRASCTTWASAWKPAIAWACWAPNGAGKSTLVKTLVGELPVIDGERNAHPDMRIGYFAQHTVESLMAGQTPIDHLRKVAGDLPTQQFRDFLGKWNFPGDRAFESIDGSPAARRRAWRWR
jgi:ATP-binding cassette subfamily F protein 3